MQNKMGILFPHKIAKTQKTAQLSPMETPEPIVIFFRSLHSNTISHAAPWQLWYSLVKHGGEMRLRTTYLIWLKAPYGPANLLNNMLLRRTRCSKIPLVIPWWSFDVLALVRFFYLPYQSRSVQEIVSLPSSITLGFCALCHTKLNAMMLALA